MNQTQNPTVAMRQRANDAATTFFRSASVLFGDVLETLPPEKMSMLADAITAGGKITSHIVMPVGLGVPDITFCLLLPNGQEVEIANINIGHANANGRAAKH